MLVFKASIKKRQVVNKNHLAQWNSSSLLDWVLDSSSSSLVSEEDEEEELEFGRATSLYPALATTLPTSFTDSLSDESLSYWLRSPSAPRLDALDTVPVELWATPWASEGSIFPPSDHVRRIFQRPESESD